MKTQETKEKGVTIVDAPTYYITKNGDVYNSISGAKLLAAGGSVRMYDEKKRKITRKVIDLMRMYHPESEMVKKADKGVVKTTDVKAPVKKSKKQQKQEKLERKAERRIKEITGGEKKIVEPFTVKLNALQQKIVDTDGQFNTKVWLLHKTGFTAKEVRYALGKPEYPTTTILAIDSFSKSKKLQAKAELWAKENKINI